MRGYFSTPISEHLEETPEGFLIARDCVIARTGFQTYKVSDLPQEAARDMGVDTSNPNAEIDLYRPASEVFHPDTLKSGEGKAVTYNHPPDFINPHNFNEYSRGHLQNVRRGSEQLESGDLPMLGDVLIMAEPLLSDVKNKRVRELSLGYDYSIARDGERINQTDMVINHLAVVPKGRAGPEARIMDAAPASESPPEPAASPPEPSTGHDTPIVNATITVKEKHKVKNRVLDLLGRGFKALAGDAEATPEEIAQAAIDVGKYHDTSSNSARARAADAAEEEEEEPVEDKGKGKDKGRGKDKRAKDDLGDPPDKDVEPADDRKRLHDAFDAMLDRRGKDADIAELRALMDEFLGEEEEEPEHAAVDIEPADTAELEKVIGEETDAEPCPECGEMGDACQCVDDEAEPGEAVVESGEEELEPAAANDKAKGKDRARAGDAVDGAKAVLKLIRPYVARSNDAGLRSTFNAALGSVTRTSRPSNGNVSKFAAAARARDRAGNNPHPDRARAGDSGQDRNAKLQAAYDAARTGKGAK